jgi:hypothetical protein
MDQAGPVHPGQGGGQVGRDEQRLPQPERSAEPMLEGGSARISEQQGGASLVLGEFQGLDGPGGVEVPG